MSFLSERFIFEFRLPVTMLKNKSLQMKFCKFATICSDRLSHDEHNIWWLFFKRNLFLFLGIPIPRCKPFPEKVASHAAIGLVLPVRYRSGLFQRRFP